MKAQYKIILLKDNKQNQFIGSYTTEKKAYTKFYQLLKENKKIKFPMRFTNLNHKITETKFELIIVKRRNKDEKKVTLLRNSYGEFIEHETNDDEWIVYEKSPYEIEETFWVYGYNPHLQRKNFDFIFHNIIKPKASKKTSFLTIYVYLNKVLIDACETLDFVICKNRSDAIRLYNAIEETCHQHKLKYVFFNGNCITTKQRKEAENKLQNLTHWNLLKIRRNSTRP